jgi:spermidine/putrescine transport system ATP-binding protein
MTVAENVAYGLRQKGVARDDVRRRVAEALDMVDMTRLAGRHPRQLSGGQQQRVALARALVNRPSLLLLDEPLGALDRKLRQGMQIELKLLQTQVGITFVYVTHDQEEALAMSDRVAVMLDGRVQQLGTPDDVYDRPATAFVAGFVGQQNFLAGTAVGNGAEVVADGLAVVGVRRAGDVRVGAGALAAVRPEHVGVSLADPGRATNVVRGTLAGVAHLGEVVQYVVRTTGRRDLVSRQPRHTAARLSAGDEVWCTWSPEHVHIFGDGQATRVLLDPTRAPAPD